MTFNEKQYIKKCMWKYERNKFRKFFMMLGYYIQYPFSYIKHLPKDKKINLRNTLLKALLIIAIFAVIAVSGYFILRSCGFTTAEDFKRLRDSLGDNWLFWLVIALLQIFQVIFIPISNQIITVPLALIFPVDQIWKVYLCSWLSIWVATMILYFIGRWGGKKLLGWLLKDQEQVDKCTNLLHKGKAYFVALMLLPFPDDIVIILAGAGKLGFLYVMIASLFTRGVDVACSVWGIGYLTRLGWWGWLILALGIVALIIFTILFRNYEKKREIKTKNISN